MKIAHLADLHITEGPFFDRAGEALLHAWQAGAGAGVELWLIAGDIWGTRVPHRPTEKERLLFADFVRALADTAPVVIIYGNHDSRDVLTLMKRLRTEREVFVSETTNLYELEELSLAVVTASYPRKGWMLAQAAAAGIEPTRVALSERFDTIIRMQLEQASAHLKHLVVLAHCNVAGSRVGGGELLTGQEVELDPTQIDAWFDAYPRLRYVALGHIHRMQSVTRNAWYAGALFAQNRGERHAHGFRIIELDDRGVVRDDEIGSPGAPLMTVDLILAQHREGEALERLADMPDVKGADVLLRIEISEEQRGMKMEGLTEALLVMGAVAVRVELAIIPKTRTRAAALLEGGPKPLTEQLAYLWSLWTPAPDPQVAEAALAYLPELEEAST